jgi:HEAT repeat protein
LGKLIDSLGSVMLDINNPESGRAATALAYTGDKRTIKYFAQALKKFANEREGMDLYFRSSQAAAALSRFNDDDALAALAGAMDSPVEMTRLDIASALGDSQHPRALGLLLKMRGDGYWFVRLRVAQALAHADTADTLDLLREMLNDENEEVRKAARDSLDKRGQK